MSFLQRRIPTAFFVVLIAVCRVPFQAHGQVPESESPAPAGEEVAAEEARVLPEAGSRRLEPVFPPDTRSLIHLEAEDAVSTNFAKEPTLNYSASGYRTVQLSRYTGLRGDGKIYVMPVDGAARISTGERGDAAV